MQIPCMSFHAIVFPLPATVPPIRFAVVPPESFTPCCVLPRSASEAFVPM